MDHPCKAALIITADDFGYHPRYDAGILAALEAGAVDAVSVMVERVDELPGLLGGSTAALGVHLEDAGRGLEVESRIDRFAAIAGRPPDYLDGHHHCHAEPRVAKEVAAVAAERDLPVRSIGPEHRRILRERGVRTPDRLISRYAESEPAMPRELEEGLPDGWTEWMVHPGLPAGDEVSSYDAGRKEDLDLLIGLRLPAGVRRADHRSLPSR